MKLMGKLGRRDRPVSEGRPRGGAGPLGGGGGGVTGGHVSGRRRGEAAAQAMVADVSMGVSWPSAVARADLALGPQPVRRRSHRAPPPWLSTRVPPARAGAHMPHEEAGEAAQAVEQMKQRIAEGAFRPRLRAPKQTLEQPPRLPRDRVTLGGRTEVRAAGWGWEGCSPISHKGAEAGGGQSALL